MREKKWKILTSNQILFSSLFRIKKYKTSIKGTTSITEKQLITVNNMRTHRIDPSAEDSVHFKQFALVKSDGLFCAKIINSSSHHILLFFVLFLWSIWNRSSYHRHISFTFLHAHSHSVEKEKEQHINGDECIDSDAWLILQRIC